jgi:7,8-dihydroneopterin aldolase/epimerase/oxygenase
MRKLHTEISLEGLEFFAYHGYYPEEKSKGNNFSVDLKVTIGLDDEEVNKLEKTINYESMYAIVEKEMGESTALLETVAARIIEAIFIQFTRVQEAEVAVSKFNPPIKGKCSKAKVLIKRVR